MTDLGKVFLDASSDVKPDEGKIILMIYRINEHKHSIFNFGMGFFRGLFLVQGFFRVLIFAPIRLSPSLEIPSTPPPPPVGLSLVWPLFFEFTHHVPLERSP